MTYTIDWVILTQEQIDKIIKDNTKKESEGRYFFPKMEEQYCFIENGIVWTAQDINVWVDQSRIYMWAYRTEKEAQKARDRQLALVRIWKYVQENWLYFEPDWRDVSEYKWYSYYTFWPDSLFVDYCFATKNHDILPRYKSKEDCTQVNKACEEDIKIVLGVI
jgi:hypothetical protein